MSLEAPKPIRVLPEDVWCSLVEFVAEHETEIIMFEGDWGALRNVLHHILSVTEPPHAL